MSDGSSPTLASLVVLLVGLTLLSGCAEVLEAPEESDDSGAASSLAAEASTADGWIEIRLLDGPEAPYAREEIHSSVTDPEGRTANKLCATAETGDDGCAEDFSGEWGIGEAVWFPCLAEGLHHVEIHVLGGQALSDGVTCDHRTGADSAGETGPEQAAATAKGVDLDDNGDVEWVQLTLTSGENAPYNAGDVSLSVRDHEGQSQDFACDTASSPACRGSPDEFRQADGDEWDVGENLWVPCQGDGNHMMTVEIHGSTILDSSVRCDETP